MYRPKEGEFITIKSYKHDGSLHRTWRNSMVLKTSDNQIIAVNDHTVVEEADGRKWMTREPAILYFHKKYWFNIVTMLRPKGISYYCNLASPFVMDKEALKYIDYDLDIKVFPDGEKRLLDVDEYQRHRKQMDYPDEINQIILDQVEELVDWIKHEEGPFSKEFVQIWYERYCQLTHRM
ncbi:nucleoside tri-diphosphate phosphatase [Atopobacter phocae]|uniref:nucleoside tri-diphosphate phosphatase n=1 Tax=Atopobacter phocae TaxID=136492 RepID=UPI000472B802|nr:DUF402 domain-containing protein [Atopobacter phocae]